MITTSNDESKPIDTAEAQRNEEEKKPRKWELINKRWAATVIFSGFILLLIASLLNRPQIFLTMLSYVFSVLRPITIGLVIAFLLYQPTVHIEKFLKKIQKKAPRFPVLGVSVFLSYTLMFVLLAGIIRIILPQFIESIHDFGDNLMIYYNNVMRFLNSERGEQILKILNENGFDPATLRAKLTDLTTYIPAAVGTVGTWAGGLIGGVIDFFIGLIFSVYVLAGRYKLRRQGTRILRHFLPQKHYNRLSHYGRLTFSTFSNFISGQITDAFILGLLIFCVMSIGKLEYPMMIAVIIGLTNMIPYVGPWLGTIPCALILLIINPLHAIAFVVIVIIAQQVDSNLIYPRVVGSSVGLPAIWVLFAITVGGGLFGVMGMLMGVPVMSVIYAVMREKTEGSDTDSNESKPKKRWKIKKVIQKIQNRFQDKSSKS